MILSNSSSELIEQGVEAAKDATGWLALEWGVSKGIVLLLAAGIFIWWLSRRTR